MSDVPVPERVLVQRVEVPPVVIDGFDVIMPTAPIGEFAVALNTRLVVAEIVAVPFIALAAGEQLVNFGGAYMGHSLKESTGVNPANIDFYDGSGVTGVLLCPITLLANESTRDWYPLPGITVQGGLFANVTLGAVTGVVYFGIPSEQAHRHRHEH